ncbi:MAG: flagellar hook-associated protein FlgK [Alphaproteobacteria bacterium CG_4_9_14_3_um_filter_47_13]|nr:MAG: flagellar hook-associated protein FlgK [Alphaproteobacteria bacterium CG_4_9_14_3_um_filter_47_13]
MGLNGLDSALSGLRAAQQQLNVIANNVSNVNTEGYTRKILPQAAVSVGGETAGVRASALIRNVDLNLERDFWTQVSTVNALEIKSKYMDRIQQFHGPPNLEISIAAEVAELRDVFAALADSPEDTFLQRSVVDQASLVSGKINKLAALITEMRNDTQDELDTSVINVNTMLANISQLNSQIKFNSASGKTIAELSDQRDNIIKQLSEEIDISFFMRGDGVMVVQTANGVQLADERPETLYYNRTPIGPSSYYPDPNNPVANGIFVGGNPAKNPVAIDITQSGLDGKMGALLELRDEILPAQQAMLDELAHKLTMRFQQQGLTLFTDKNGRVPASSTAQLTGAINLTALAGGGSLAAASGTAPNDTFTITLNAGGTSPQQRTLTINLTAAEAAFPFPPAADGAASLVSYINAQVDTLPDAFSNTTASLNASGQLAISSKYDISISASGAGQMGDFGLTVIGLTRGTEYAAPKTNPLTPVPYVGYSSEIRVSQMVIDNDRLVQQGTVPTDIPVQNGSNEVIRRVIESVFGDVKFQEAIGTVDLRAIGVGGTTMQDWLGIYSKNTVTSTLDLTGYSDVSAIIAAGGDTFIPPSGPVLDQFTLTFDDPRTGLPAQTYYLDLEEIQANFPIGGAITNAADQMAAAINALPLAASALSDPLPPDAGFNVQASVNAYGQLVIQSRANITLDASFPAGDDFGVPPADGGMRDTGLGFLGLTAGNFTTTDPYIDIQIGNDLPIRITIEPGDDETDLYTKLNKVLPGGPGVPGLAVDDDLTNLAGGGTLILQPGDDPSDPRFGGDIKIFGSLFVSEGGANGTLAGTSIIAALFGTENPVRNVPHEISTGTGSYESFRRQRLGPNAAISTGIISSTNLIDFAQKMVNGQSAETIAIDRQKTDETAFRDLLQRRLLDESGVNLDEELANLIVIQTAFAAAARVISAIDEEFQELLNAIR